MKKLKLLEIPVQKQNIKLLKAGLLLSLLTVLLINSFFIPMPEGTSYEGSFSDVSNIEFIYDLSYKKNGEVVREHRIFQELIDLIEGAEEFIIIDMFLFNDDYSRKNEFPKLSEKLTDTLIQQKEKRPNLKIMFITDEINNFYGAYESNHLKQLKSNDIDVVVTDSTKMRNPNPLYSGFWKTFLQWFGTEGKGWIRNPFSEDSPKVTLRSYLKLLKFKANHRKVLITDKAAIVTSANPHDASAYHSNIAFKVEGEVINDLIKTEQAVAKFSGNDFEDIEYISSESTIEDIKVMVITEGKIRQHIVDGIKATKADDRITIGMFYLAERRIIKELIKASDRGVDIRLILDANKDAFGIEKNGIPNRQVATELVKKSKGKIQVKWYNTYGEQYHAKLMVIENDHAATIIGGSANFTVRNIGDYNLETNLKIVAPKESRITGDVLEYFDRIWENQEGNYTVDFSKYQEENFFKTMMYRFQEWSGLSTF
ncbi:phosphatidylserine/phosphatidylglycerophosphate/cardiolipin synthase [Clostridium aceticum]|uniref:Phosphatidylserine/phosphatidylglycerophosphate/ cardiolipin synthase n=1 Tax=Clostridium aceticum TaxID=84022 RepID=A0A0D8IBQ4_9CLOT|nr:phospholipase D family protein [Clostridium aceticum]AKL96447.1 phosphatidylserine/phosphatidylglycerophosphate/cardiolipin synthase [Clostridium aceticum]KJF27377.1 phospholipase [Clostridium aceticum]